MKTVINFLLFSSLALSPSLSSAMDFIFLPAEKVDSSLIQPKFDAKIPTNRTVFKIYENTNGNIKVNFYRQINLAINDCTFAQGNTWTCPVRTFIYQLSDLELKNNQLVYYKDQLVGQLAVSVNDDSVKFVNGYEILDNPVSGGFILRKTK